jgi:lipopolysaccharide transport system permease protein
MGLDSDMRVLTKPENPRSESLKIWKIVGMFFQHRNLITSIASRELQARYRGSNLGILWYVLLPMLMLAVYTIVFSFVFKSRWPGQQSEEPMITALYICSGIMIFTLFAEVFGRAPTLVLENPTYVKKIIFPLEVLPWISLLSALSNVLIYAILLTALHFAVKGWPPATALALPIVLVPLCVLLLGLSWILGALGVFVRDLKHLTGTFVSICLFISPIFFPADKFPQQLSWLLWLNPITVPVELSKDVIFHGTFERFYLLVPYSIVAITIAAMGYWGFMRTKRAFADVI